jgi:signal transduction histidine kinase
MAAPAVLAYFNYLLAVRIRAAECARSRAEQAERELQSFLGMVAHDLRSPLTAIQMNTDLLQASGASAELSGKRGRSSARRRSACGAW